MKSEASIEDQRIQVKLLKKELKAWEYKFQQEYGRKPDKQDIASIAEVGKSILMFAIRYKAYAKLKAFVDKQEESVKESKEKLYTPSASIVRTVEQPISPIQASPKQEQRGVTANIISKEYLISTLKQENTPAHADSTEEQKQENKEVPKFKVRKTNIGAGPVATADVGSNMSRFNKRVQQAEAVPESQVPQELPLPAYTKHSDSLTELNNPEVSEFFQRRQQLENIASPQKLAPIQQDTSVQKATATLDQPRLNPITTSVSAKVVRVGEPEMEVPPIIATPGEVRKASMKQQPPPEYEENEIPELTEKVPPLPRRSTTSKENEKPLWNEKPLEKQPNEGSGSIPTSDPASVVTSDEHLESPALATEQQVSSDDISPTNLAVGVEDVIEQQTNEPLVKNQIHDFINVPVKTLPSLIVHDLFQKVPKEGVLRCKLFRKKNILGQTNPTYILHNEQDNSILVSAKRMLLSKSVNYIISDSAEEISKDSIHYVAKLKANFKRTNFILTDVRKKELKELAIVIYSKNVLPRELQVGIKAMDIEHDAKFTTDISGDFKMNNEKKLLLLKNKAPRWNEATQSHCLNFGGRVTQPSIKNMQLISSVIGENYNVLQFGRCGPDYFSLDVRWPMSPIEAFGIALTTFDAYDSA
ncbi:hypothetical protein HK103_007393 [Boothiomyces macroporosus]|uniref:Tubby C-terminal domain-containing protein n=1 Tax=Boothiomyces macroporosus TaxID=261099 RepID=A0AAD5UKV0_9FUNG|nr:hypothetical protein HK103_007393 [Boothiomyces macroporosus]